MEAQLQYHFKICPTVIKMMDIDELMYEYLKLKYVIEEQNKAYKDNK